MGTGRSGLNYHFATSLPRKSYEVRPRIGVQTDILVEVRSSLSLFNSVPVAPKELS